MTGSDVLIVDDEADIRNLVAGILEDEGHSCRTAKNSDDAIDAIRDRQPDLVILDIWLERSDLDGMDILKHIREQYWGLPVVMISGHANVAVAVEATKLGAYDFIEKPFNTERLVVTVSRAIEAARLQKENAELRQRTEVSSDFVGVSPSVRHLRTLLEKVAPTDSRVFISGPPGSGKEVYARQLHRRSTRANSPFVALNCAAMTPDRVELELFGGRWEGSESSSIGTLESAHGGVLFLDEISDMPLETQGKIVRVLQEQAFTRTGRDEQVHVDVRVFASTSKNMEEEMAAGNFRQDLFYRLSVVPIQIPPLKDRREDIPVLFKYYMEQAASKSGQPLRKMSDQAMAVLESYDWPGNVRQLRNVVDWVLIMAPADPRQEVSVANLPSDVCGEGSDLLSNAPLGETVMSLSLREARESFERHYLHAQMARFSGNVSRTAGFIGMERSALYRKLKSLGIDAREQLVSSGPQGE